MADKKENQQPQWFQQSSLGQTVNDTQAQAQQWANNALGGLPDQATAYAQQLQQQGQDWFNQTPVGQGVNDFYTSFMEPLETYSTESQKQYQQQLDNIKASYDNALKKMGVL